MHSFLPEILADIFFGLQMRQPVHRKQTMVSGLIICGKISNQKAQGWQKRLGITFNHHYKIFNL